LEAGCDTQGVEWWSCLFEMKGVLVRRIYRLVFYSLKNL
jgi:hypothetical protein